MAGATENIIQAKGYDAAGAVVKGHFVKITALETVGPVTASTDNPVGVAYESVTAGEILKGKGVSVVQRGRALCKSSAAITAGVPVSIAADGRVKAAATGERVVGTCHEGCANADEYVSVDLWLAGHLSA